MLGFRHGPVGGRRFDFSLAVQLAGIAISRPTSGIWPARSKPDTAWTMQLSGRLRLTTLGDLLGTILREKLSGSLELTEEKGPRAGRVHRLHLHLGHVVQVDTEETVQRLGEILADSGWFERGVLPQLVRHAAEAQVPFGQWLVDSGKVPSDAMMEAVVQQLKRRLEALFRVEDARIAFRLVQSRRRELDVPRLLSAREYLLGMPRARDRANRDSAKSVQRADAYPERRRDLILLGLAQDADETAIRSAFRRLARTLHPDAHPTANLQQRESLRQRFADVSAAYHRLVDARQIAV